MFDRLRLIGIRRALFCTLRSQGFLIYPKSPKSEPFLAILGKTQNTPRESEKWHTCTLAYSRVEIRELPKR